MKTAVSIPDQLFRSAERLAKRLKIRRSQLYARALERYVAEMSNSEITKRLNEVYAHEDSELDPVLAAMQAEAVGRERW